MGEEKLKKIEIGIKDYINTDRKGKTSQEIYEAIEILSSLGDFMEFKRVMLAKKAEANGEEPVPGGLSIINKGVMDVQEFMDRLGPLASEASATDGWTEILNE